MSQIFNNARNERNDEDFVEENENVSKGDHHGDLKDDDNNLEEYERDPSSSNSANSSNLSASRQKLKSTHFQEIQDFQPPVLKLPIEIWMLITSYLLSSDLVNFYRGCNHRLQKMLTERGGVSSFQSFGSITSTHLRHRIGTTSRINTGVYVYGEPEKEHKSRPRPKMIPPESIMHFRKLTVLRIVSGDPLGPSALQMMSLPDTLRVLEFEFPAALTCFMKNRPNSKLYLDGSRYLPAALQACRGSSDPWLPMELVLPQLETLVLLGLVSIGKLHVVANDLKHPSILKWLDHIPKSVTSFCSDYFPYTEGSAYSKIPPYLKSWIIPPNHAPNPLVEFADYAPKHIISLECPSYSLDDSKLQLLPECLKNLHLFSIKPDQLSMLPKGLKHLKTKVSLDSTNVEHIPPSLVTLNLTVGKMSASLFKHFPPSLKVLILRWCIEDFDEQSIHYLPKSLTHLELGGSILLDENIALLPPHLTYLKVEPGRMYDTSLKYINPMITTFSITSVVATGALLNQSIVHVNDSVLKDSVSNYFNPPKIDFHPFVEVELRTCPPMVEAISKDIPSMRIPIHLLPRTLTSLNTDYPFDDSNIHLLPPSLTSIITKSTIKTSSLNLLPAGIRSFRGGKIVGLEEDWISFCESHPTKLDYPQSVSHYRLKQMPQLTFVAYAFDSTTFMDASVKHFPDSITKLKINGNHHLNFTSLPSKLISLWFGSSVSHLPRRGLTLLPPSLTELRLHLVSHEDLDAVDLPPSLTTLILVDSLLSQNVDSLARIPRNVTWLSLSGSANISPSHLSSLPPKLTSLRLDTSELTMESIDLFPVSLISLKLGTDSNLSASQVVKRCAKRRAKLNHSATTNSSNTSAGNPHSSADSSSAPNLSGHPSTPTHNPSVNNKAEKRDSPSDFSPLPGKNSPPDGPVIPPSRPTHLINSSKFAAHRDQPREEESNNSILNLPSVMVKEEKMEEIPRQPTQHQTHHHHHHHPSQNPSQVSNLIQLLSSSPLTESSFRFSSGEIAIKDFPIFNSNDTFQPNPPQIHQTPEKPLSSSAFSSSIIPSKAATDSTNPTTSSSVFTIPSPLPASLASASSPSTPFNLIHSSDIVNAPPSDDQFSHFSASSESSNDEDLNNNTDDLERSQSTPYSTI